MKKVNIDAYKSMVKWLDRSYSEEVYFGPNCSLALSLKDFVIAMRKQYECSPYKKNEPKKSKNSKWTDELRRELVNHEKALAKAVNAKEVTVALQPDVNAACFPLFFDKDLIHKEKISGTKKTKYTYNQKYIDQLQAVVETKDGFKFAESGIAHVVLIFGFGLFDAGLNDDEITAIMLHEFGHTFQHVLVDLKTQVYCQERVSLIETMVQNSSLLLFISSLGFSGILLAILGKRNKELAKNENKKNKVDDEVERILVDNYKLNEQDKELGYLDRSTLRDQVEDGLTDPTIDMLNQYSEKKVNVFSKIISFINFIIDSIAGIIYTPYSFLKPLLDLISPTKYIMGSNRKFLEKNMRYEQFSDMTAAAYGYGPHLAQGLIKMRKYTGNPQDKDLGAFNFLHYVPIVNAMIAWANWQDMRNNLLLFGYPPDIQRYEGVYKSLAYELQTNKGLSPEQREAIQKDMEEIRKIHQDYISKGTKNWALRWYLKITRKSIESAGDKSKMAENVLIPLQEVLEEAKRESK